MRITLRSSETKTFFDHGGGPVWDSNVFWNRSLTGQHLANSGEGQLKKNTLYKTSFGKPRLLLIGVWEKHVFFFQKCPLLIRLWNCTQAEIRTQTAAASSASEKFCVCFCIDLYSLTVQIKRFNCLNVFEVSKLWNLKWSAVNSESEKNSTKSFLKS